MFIVVWMSVICLSVLHTITATFRQLVLCLSLPVHIKVKCKFHLITGHKGTEGEHRYNYILSLTSELEGVNGHRHTPAALPPAKRPSTHCTGGWMGLRASLDTCRKSHPPPRFDPWSVQPVTSRYTDYAIPVHVVYHVDVFSSNCVMLDVPSRGM
jgi:hypothetical protein